MPNFMNKQTGTVTSNNDAVTIAFRHNTNGGIGIYVADGGTWTGTITFEATRDGTNWFSVLVTSDTTGSASTTTTVKGGFYWNAVGILSFRARLSSVGGNTATVTLIANPG